MINNVDSRWMGFLVVHHHLMHGLSRKVSMVSRVMIKSKLYLGHGFDSSGQRHWEDIGWMEEDMKMEGRFEMKLLCHL